MGLSGQFADEQRTKSDAPKSECPNFTFGNMNFLLGAFIFGSKGKVLICSIAASFIGAELSHSAIYDFV